MPSRLHRRRAPQAARTVGVLAFAGLTLVLALALFAVARSAADHAVAGTVRVTPHTVHIGDVIRVEIPASLPWRRRLRGGPQLTPPDGLQILDATARLGPGLGWGTWTWTAVLRLQAYDRGPFVDLTVRLPVSPDRHGRNRTVTAVIPDITVAMRVPADAHRRPRMAGDIDPRERTTRPWQHRPWRLAAGVLLLALGLCAMRARLSRRRHRSAPLTPGETAEIALARLETDLPMDAPMFFSRLSDVLRRYVQETCRLPARELTTPELLRQIRHSDDRLTDGQHLALRELLTAADMVKFARAPATDDELRDALRSARRFVGQTSESRGQQAAEVTP